MARRFNAAPLVGSQVLGEDGAERRVGAVHPAPRRHAVGHVHDLVLGSWGGFFGENGGKMTGTCGKK